MPSRIKLRWMTQSPPGVGTRLTCTTPLHATVIDVQGDGLIIAALDDEPATWTDDGWAGGAEVEPGPHQHLATAVAEAREEREGELAHIITRRAGHRHAQARLDVLMNDLEAALARAREAR